jgi:serine/threonine-protein kinase HipA
MPDGKMGFGDGDLASNTIVKFQNLNNKTPHLVLNEFFCLTLARKVGFTIPGISFKKIGAHPALFIQRFDREWNKNTITRKHIIDGCQATNLPASYKYERNLGSSRDVTEVRDGVSLQKIFEFNRHCVVPAKTAIDILNWTILNLCIGNADAHGKNISYFVDKFGIQLAPLYDLVNIAVYPELEKNLAMSVGDEFDALQVKGFQLLTFSEQIGIDKKLIGRQFKILTDKILSSLDSIEMPAEEMNADFENVLKKSIKTRTKHFQLCAQEALKIKA